MPLKIEFPGIEDGCNTIVVGVGNKGREIVKNLSYPFRGCCKYVSRKLVLCDDTVFRFKRKKRMQFYEKTENYLEKCKKCICHALKESQLLFIIADSEIASDMEMALKLSKLQYSGELKNKHSILIDVREKDNFFEERCVQEFDAVVNVTRRQQVDRTICLLLHDMHQGLVGCDFKDVSEFLFSGSELTYVECNIKDRSQLEFLVERCLEKVKPKRKKYSAMVSLLVPHTSNLEEVFRIFNELEKTATNGELLFQYNITPYEMYSISMLITI